MAGGSLPRQLEPRSRPLLLDLFCCQGGAAKGYHDAGFDIVGVDIEPQPRYPFGFWRDDALEILRGISAAQSHDLKLSYTFDAIHASPPCQAYSNAQRLRGNHHERLIAALRQELDLVGLPYVIENVGGARDELRDPVMICGPMVGVDMYRHRYFETNWPLRQMPHPPHEARQVKMGRSPKPGEFIQAVGNFAGVQQAREVMEMPWANRDGLREAIPPAYTRHIGEHLLNHIADRMLADAA